MRTYVCGCDIKINDEIKRSRGWDIPKNHIQVLRRGWAAGNQQQLENTCYTFDKNKREEREAQTNRRKSNDTRRVSKTFA